MKKLVLNVLLVLGFLRGNAQDNGYSIPHYEPPSPEASALGKYIDHPVSTFTGTPSVTIPLFEIKTGRITVPINISYHGSGVKVDEIASRAGTGWVLNAGGVITRTAKGLPDDAGGPTPPLSSPAWAQNGKGYFYRDNNDQSFEFAGSDPTSPYVNDLDPDDFYYKFGNYSGRLFFSDPFSAYTLNKDYLTINTPFDSHAFLNRFIVTDDNGLIYTFSDAEGTENISVSGLSATGVYYTSSWYLTKIQDPVTNKTVQFTYRTDMQNTTLSYGATMFEGQGVSCGNSGGGTSTTYVKYPKVLQKITYDEGYIEFKSDYSRADLVGDKAYNEINQYIYTDNSQTTASLKKGFNFSYYTSSNGSNPENKRLYLETIEEKGADGSLLPPYAFFYKNRDQLPARQSPQQDIWGYYNANGATATGLSKVYVRPYVGYLPFDNPTSPATTVLSGVERSANPTVTDYGTLIKAVYPTKGYTLYTYEANKFDVYTGGGIRIKAIGDYSYNDQLLLLKNYNYTNGFLGGPMPEVGFPGGYGPVRFALNRTVLGSNDGNYVGYESVSVNETSPSNPSLNNGTKAYTYSTDRDVPGTFTVAANGCTELNSLSTIQANSSFPFFAWESRENRRGLLLRETTLDAQNKMVKEIDRNYTLSTTNLGTIHSNFIIYNPDGHRTNLTEDLRGTRNLNRDIEMLTSEDDGLYEGSSDDRSIREIIPDHTVYTYTQAPYDGLYVRSETHYTGEEGTGREKYVSTLYKYPFDYASTASSGVMGDMVNMNYISPVISKTVASQIPVVDPTHYPDTQLQLYNSAGELTNYKHNANSATSPNTSIVPAQISKLNTMSPTYSESSDVFPPDPANPGSHYEKQVEFVNYNSNANPILVMQNQKYQILAWSSFGDHLLSKKQVSGLSSRTTSGTSVLMSGWSAVADANARTGTIDYAWSGSDIAIPLTLDGLSTTNISFWAKGGSFNINAVPGSGTSISIAQTAPSTWKYYSFDLATNSANWYNGLVHLTGGARLDEINLTTGKTLTTIYDYDPLQRLRSVLDPNGGVKVYDYDNFSRLINIRDQDNNIVKHFDYHYKGQ